MVDDADDPGLFERLYQAFMRLGGFSRPALSEDWEREYRDPSRKKHRPTPCPHGKTRLTCDICYFNEGWTWGGR